MKYEPPMDLPSVPGVEFRHTRFAGYAVGDDGSIWSAWRSSFYGRCIGDWRRIKGSLASGYRNIVPHNATTKTHWSVAFLVCEAFNGPQPDGYWVLHGNGNRQDNRPCNLRWGTRSDNTYDAVRHGTHCGLASRIAVNRHLTAEQAAYILSRKATRTRHTALDISREFGIHKSCVHKIWRGERYVTSSPQGANQ